MSSECLVYLLHVWLGINYRSEQRYRDSTSCVAAVLVDWSGFWLARSVSTILVSISAYMYCVAGGPPHYFQI